MFYGSGILCSLILHRINQRNVMLIYSTTEVTKRFPLV